jgi:hypothetical protein
MRGLRVRHGGRLYWIHYAIDAPRTAIILVGGDKVGNDWRYDTYAPLADRLYDGYVAQLRIECEPKHGKEL